jgi:hypothetical protein
MKKQELLEQTREIQGKQNLFNKNYKTEKIGKKTK